ncbi:cell division protein FtsA [Baia soyae]|uniref:Cell division protein FtsA n=1 Tax=Baia soyae TaxID=1544746 RepID=A0A4R2S283_9BACL|nr:cell division protein FtsA [Baia soyae]TCP70423.1 cell division protein FtsA [Baia soyae]
MNDQFIVTLDIGTTQIKAFIAEMHADGNLQIVGVGTAKSLGMKKGAIVDLDQAVFSVRQAIQQAERMVGIEISKVYVGISGNHVAVQHSHGLVAVSSESRVIENQDLDRVLQACRVINLPQERTIFDVVPTQYIVDGVSEIRDPRGMFGVRLEVEAMVLTATKTVIQNMERCLEKAQLEIAGVIYLPHALGEACLTLDEKQIGVVLLDFGGGTITISAYHQGNLTGTAVIPMGGEYLTSDIAIVLRTHSDVAEEIKCKYGCALADLANKNESFSVQTLNDQKEVVYQQDNLAEIIESRLSEMFYLVRQQLQYMGVSDRPSGGFVLTGGVMSTRNILATAQKYLGQPVRVAQPENIGVNEPSYMGGVSMVHYLDQRGMIQVPETIPNDVARSKKQHGESAFSKMKNWFSDFI